MTTQTPTITTQRTTTRRRTTKRVAAKKAAAPTPAAKPGEKPVVPVTNSLLTELRKRWAAKIKGKHSGDVSVLVVRTSPMASLVTTTRELTDTERNLLAAGPSQGMSQTSALNLKRLLDTTMKRPVTHEGSGQPKTGRGAWDPQEGRCIGLRPGQTVSTTPKPGVIAKGPNFQPKGPSVHGVVVPNKKKEGKKK